MAVYRISSIRLAPQIMLQMGRPLRTISVVRAAHTDELDLAVAVSARQAVEARRGVVPVRTTQVNTGGLENG